MRKIAILMILLGLSIASYADNTVVLILDSLPSSTTYYILVDVSDTTNFQHPSYITDMRIKSYEVGLSSNTQEIKIGYIYTINASSMEVKWIDRFYRTTGGNIIYQKVDYGKGLNIYEGGDLKVANTTDTNITNNDKLRIYDNSTVATPGVKDIIVYIKASEVTTKLSIKLTYIPR